MTTETKPEGYPETPTLDKRHTVIETSQAIGEFIDWLHEQHVVFAEYKHVHSGSRVVELWGDECETTYDANYRRAEEGGKDVSGIYRFPHLSGGAGWLKWMLEQEDGEKTIAEMKTRCYHGSERLIPRDSDPSRLLHDYFGIDAQAEDQEMRAVLEWARRQNEPAS